MSPVHVIVGEDPRATTIWADAFGTAVDLYTFGRNVEAFERLTAAQAPVDLVVLTPAQGGPFNLTPDQFVARVLDGPLGASRSLANLHVVVVGAELRIEHPRAMAVSTLDAAIRLVKFGEMEAPRRRAPQAAARIEPVVAAQPSRPAAIESILDGSFAGSVISSIWDAPRQPAAMEPTVPTREQREDDAVRGGGPVVDAAPAVLREIGAMSSEPELFARSTATGFGRTPVSGGGAAAMAMPTTHVAGEAIEVASGLQPARRFHMPDGASTSYRGPAPRGTQVHGAGHAFAPSGAQPIPPALASQVTSMVYGSVGRPEDPILIWSSALREQTAAAAPPVPAAPAPAAPVVAAAMSMPAMSATPVAMQPMPAMLPMEPPAGAYGAPATSLPAAYAAAAMPAQPAAPVDPFLARAERDGPGVAFG